MKEVIVRRGWMVAEESPFNWLLVPVDDSDGAPIPLSKLGRVVDPELINWISRTWPKLGEALGHAVHQYITDNL